MENSRTLTLEYQNTSTINFHISDDINFNWISDFDSNMYKRIFFVIDYNVKKIWGKKILANLKDQQKEIFEYVAVAEERTKSLEYYPKFLEYFEKNRCSRFDLVVVVGGGIILDLVSFFCSTYMRGLHFYAIPTTIIGQVDAITAGKTCLNTSNGKNVLGTFYYPDEVYNNITLLKTNSPYYTRQGFSEVFKYGLLASRKLLDTYREYEKKGTDKLLLDIIVLTIEARSAIRQKDALASNLGHTFGHALEKISDYKLLHGDAIAVGTVISLYFSLEKGLIQQPILDAILERMKLHKLNLFIDESINIDQWIDYMLRDKKSSSKTINLVLIKDIENPYQNNNSYFYSVSPDEMRGFLTRFMDSYDYLQKECWGHLQTNYLEYE
jgi:3-dehydroquinate synthase